MMRHLASFILASLLVEQLMSPGSRSDEPNQQPKTTIAQWVASFNTAAPEARVRLAYDIAEYGAQAKLAIPTLASAMADGNGEVRAAAAWALGKLKLEPQMTIAVLIKALADDTETTKGPVWQLAGLSLGEFGAQATPCLVEALTNDNPQVCGGAAIAIYRIGPDATDAVPVLIRILEDDDPATRYFVLQALMGIGPGAKAAVPVLIEKLQSDDFHTQYWACRVLGAIGADAGPAIPDLIGLLRNGATSVRRNAAAALGDIGPSIGEQGVAALIAALRDRIQIVREDAVISLGKLGPLAKPAIPVIEEILRKDSRFAPRAEAAKALWLLSKESKTPSTVLLAELQATERPWEAARVLGEIGPALGVIPQVAAVLRSDNPMTRQYAAESLGQMGPAAASARMQLEAARSDEDEEVRASVEAAIRQLDVEGNGR